ncbi:ABC transporter ATP-binding protein [Thermoplasma sp.]|uniref:ABC transporter ATP-binding protein n=1 Tax=Thermoplasma sp. TaxID=1973142 RepID=UPI00260A3C3D|nr:ABC transporter ATP-binding protein [Thermoplasma sp.]
MLLSIKHLNVWYNTVAGKYKVIDDLNLDIDQGELVSLVGESASGKSTLGQVISRMLPPVGITSGEVILDGVDVLKLSEKEMTKIRGTTVFMIFQNPLNSLNPVKRVEDQLMEALAIRNSRMNIQMTVEEARNEVIKALASLRLPDPEKIMIRYPHELSGGQVQRVVICMALLLRPKLLIADEPTTALDVTIQAQVVKLLKDLNKDTKMTIIFITHDVGLAYVLSDRMLVFYAGRVMEQGQTVEVVKNPLHPYTSGLLASIPSSPKHTGKLYSIPGSPPSYLSLPAGCKFAPRCRFAFERCFQEEPSYIKKDNRLIRCWLYE